MSPTTQIDFKHFIKTHFAIPFTLFVVIFSSLEFTPLDFHISEYFYNSTLKQWPYKNDWLAETIIHKGGQKFSKIMGVIVFLTLLFSLPTKSPLHYCRKPLIFLFISCISGPIIIAILKSHTYIYCPWDLKLFGGKQPYIHLFDYVPANLKVGHCFPAGHAGGGFAFISLYFFLMIINPQYRFFGLYTGLLLGLVYGIAQQMRGAHFFSHDIFSLAVCWLASLSWFLVFFQKNFKQLQIDRVNILK
ncbi:MAG: phosphatase PAP2 family protein [Methylococcales bacterium]|nr:phosphatase PAP2 family protein [Methylococcales bacterium]